MPHLHDFRLVALTVHGEPWWRVICPAPPHRIWGSGETPDQAWADARRELERYRRRGE